MPYTRALRPLLAASLLALAPEARAQEPTVTLPAYDCRSWTAEQLQRNPTEAELRCRYGVRGPGRFGLLSYVDVPVYQPATPMPGTHVVAVAGQPTPRPGESYEEWEWRVLRTGYGPSVHRVHRGLELLDPRAAARIMELEQRLRAAGVRAARLETWRDPERQAFLFQQGRSRPGPLATTTLTSWHSHVDAQGNPAGRAVDYHVPASQLARFHEIAAGVGLDGFGADSNDPGHVFLPYPDEIPLAELALLRVLPRIPVVTLATGLPVDRRLPPEGRAGIRAAALDFAREPFIRYVEPAIQGGSVVLELITDTAAPSAAAAPGPDPGP